MLTLDCPYCGPRDETEFVNGGEAEGDRPGPPETVGEAEWAEHLFFHANPKGPLAERWLHAYGCRRWFIAVRDTATHHVSAIRRIDDPPAGRE